MPSPTPQNDTLTPPPVADAWRPPLDSWAAPGEEVPTFRLPAIKSPAVATPDPLASTPPPADLRPSVSAWSGEGESTSAGPTPRVGDTILGFRLVSELGRGAFARVFLAHQEALADRPVALKVTLRPTREAERLARLQHTNVVPLYSFHAVDPVQLICMPYLGRVTLADLIRAYRVEQPARSSGRKSTSARAARATSVDSGSKPGAKPAPDSKGTPRVATWTWSSADPPPIVGDPRAVLEVLVQLADGLTHAHARGILHLDIKPANVLLADSGEPMFLDFNLSFDAARPDREMVGGTVPYMAIEQLLDMRSRGKGAIDGRTDLFSLGVLAFELLTGTVPFATPATRGRDPDGQVAARRQGPPPLRALNRDVTPAVEAIVRKLLAADPADRYQTADELRTDAERHLADLPLLYAREGLAWERVGKWRRRNPGVAVRLTAACVIGLAFGLGGAVHRRAEATARHEAVERAKVARTTLDTARLDLVLPDDPKARARGIDRAAELLASYGLPGNADWRKHPDVRVLAEPDRAALAGDLGELMLLLAQAKWELAAARPEPERAEVVAEAWKLNAAARDCFGDARPALADRQAAVFAPVAGESAVAVTPEPADPTPRDLFLDAAEAIANGLYSAAIPLLDRVIAASPGHGAAQFCLAYCRQQMGQYQRALERYDAARVLLPADPRPAYQRAQIYSVLKQPAKADAEYTKAIAAAPDHADAYRYRALVRYRIGATKLSGKGEAEGIAKLAEAEADLTAAQKCGAPPLFVHSVRVKVRVALKNPAGAAAAREAAKGVPVETEADFLVRGWTLIETDPKGALADFEAAGQLNPRSLIAFQNQAHVLADRLNDNEKALVAATRAVELCPEFAPAIAGRAVVLARLGRRADAVNEIEKARLLSDDPEIIYQAASVYSVTSKAHAADREKAIALLREAFKSGYADLTVLKDDPDLDPIRGTQEFKDIRRAASTIFR